jgi:hypothetical protein
MACLVKTEFSMNRLILSFLPDDAEPARLVSGGSLALPVLLTVLGAVDWTSGRNTDEQPRETMGSGPPKFE